MVPTFDEDIANIQKLDDEPNDIGGLSADELKERFDAGGIAMQEYLNNQLIPAILADGATENARQLAEQERVANEQERVANEEARAVFENYSPTKSYKAGNKTAYMGSSYRCKKPCLGIAPTNGEYWLLIAAGAVGGEGTGNMNSSIYDPQKIGRDVYLYARELLASSRKDFAFNVPADGWTGNKASGYANTIAVDGVLGTDTDCEADVLLGANIDQNAASLLAWSHVTRVTTGDGTVTVWANFEAPVTDFTIRLKVVRVNG